MYTVENLLRDYGELIDNGKWQELFDGNSFMSSLEDIDAEQASKILYTILFDLGGIAYINKFKAAYGLYMFEDQTLQELDLSHFAEKASDIHTMMTLYCPRLEVNRLILPASDQVLNFSIRSGLDVKQLIFKPTAGKAGELKPLTSNTLSYCKNSLEYLEIPAWGLIRQSDLEWNGIARELINHEKLRNLKEICLTDTTNYAEVVEYFKKQCTKYKITTK